MDKTRKTVAIVGGGFCGLMTAVHLVKGSSHQSLSILLFTDSELGKGPAYSGSSDLHVLNVEARNMSAFPDAPAHFTEWLSKKLDKEKISVEDPSRMFAPRKWYGEYLAESARTLPGIHGDSVVEIIPQRAVAAKRSDGGFVVCTADVCHPVDFLVLATGNILPSKPKGIPASFTTSSRYVSNPWTFRLASTPESDRTVLIVGTGLTMVDVMITLREDGFRGRIVAVSPKGFEILPHRRYETVSAIKDELQPPYRLEGLFALFRKHIRIVRTKGITGEAVVDAVRPLTRSIWTSLSHRDKRRFLAHLRHLWGLARHRLPPAQHEDLRKQLAEGTFQIVAGRVLDIHEQPDGCLVTLRERKTGTTREMMAELVINCTGPATDLAAVDDPFYRSLFEEGTLQPDPLGMGILADGEGHPLGKDGKPVKGLYALGSLLKGAFWESTAIPELRMQCKEAAMDILSNTRTGF